MVQNARPFTAKATSAKLQRAIGIPPSSLQIVETTTIYQKVTVEQLTSPELQEVWRLMERAVASSPDWEKLPAERGYLCKEGARHSLPEALVRAYKKSHGLA